MYLPLLFASGGAHVFEPHVAWVTFFVLLLLSIAVLPLINEHWWENNKNRAIVSFGLALPVLIFYLIESPTAIVHSLAEYFSFIVLLWALYTISGGIVLSGTIKGRPGVNTLFLAIGAVIANIFGTTGAAMLLIRPLLRANEGRQHKKHTIIFFIFLVANVGGCLTPLGDPPLFLGYLRGVPFEWTLKLAPVWIPTVLILLTIYYLWDLKAFRKESKESQVPTGEIEPIRLDGKINFIFILGVLAAVVFSPALYELNASTIGYDWSKIGISNGGPWRELIMLTMGILSMILTPRKLREANQFNFAAIIEVAILFAGIFVTMIPATSLLSIHGHELGLDKPWQYMWVTGVLSSFLDNAPTYVIFSTAAAAGSTLHELAYSANAVLLKGVAIGAVFMGAMTYIGNAPNFMVKVIASSAAGNRRVRMPSFFGYMLWSMGILIPVYIFATLLGFGITGLFGGVL